MRIQEIHPSVVHFPIALIPAALAADAIGRFTNSRALMEIGRRLMPAAAVSAALAGVAGLIAQESVRAEGRVHAELTTHRNLNIGLIALAAGMAATRARDARPSAGYLLTGLAGLVAMGYTAYLGGKMVYEHGLGVEPAGGVRDGAAPEVRRDNLGRVARTSASHVVQGLKHAAEHVAKGELAPALSER